MTWRYNYILRPSFVLLDILVIALSQWAAAVLRYGNWPDTHIENLVASIILWILLTPLFQLNHVPRNPRFFMGVRNFLSAQAIFIGFTSFIVVLTNQDHLSRLFFVYFILIQFIALILVRVFRRNLMGYLRSHGRNLNWIFLLGTEEEHQRLVDWINVSPYSGYKLRNRYFFQGSGEQRCIDCLTWLEHALADSSGDDLIINPKYSCNEAELDQVVYLAEDLGARVHLLHPLQESASMGTTTRKVGPFEVTSIRDEPLVRVGSTFFKRSFDLIFSVLVFILLLSWFVPLVAILIKITSKGPVFFIQERTGVGRRTFKCLKFRTMRTVNRTDNGHESITKEGDSRITTIGNILRKTNLDEIPQFLNVLFGDMSVVGPRPHMVSEDREMERLIPRYRLRQRIRPGITGWAAVNGYRGGTDELELMRKRLEHDLWYIENWSISLDLKIVWRTFWQMICLKTGAH